MGITACETALADRCAATPIHQILVRFVEDAYLIGLTCSKGREFPARPLAMDEWDGRMRNMNQIEMKARDEMPHQRSRTANASTTKLQ